MQVLWKLVTELPALANKFRENEGHTTFEDGEGMDTGKVCVIRAKLKEDYVWEAIEKYGFEIFIPYKDKNIVLRLMREVWYRLGLPNRKIWYNSDIKHINAETIVVYDPLITNDFLIWLREKYPKSRIILSYENRADTTINPDCVDNTIEKWSYDKDDCEQYNMGFITPNFFDVYSFDSQHYEKKYDVLYLGRDKGRLQHILDYEREFKKQNLRTYFHICADRSYMKYKNKQYKKVLSYKEYLELVKKSNAILNIARDGQTSITQRELEAVFFNVKCITTNKGILDFEFYDPSRYFVLGEKDGMDVKTFLNLPISKIREEEIKSYKFDTVFAKIIEGEK